VLSVILGLIVAESPRIADPAGSAGRPTAVLDLDKSTRPESRDQEIGRASRTLVGVNQPIPSAIKGQTQRCDLTNCVQREIDVARVTHAERGAQRQQLQGPMDIPTPDRGGDRSPACLQPFEPRGA